MNVRQRLGGLLITLACASILTAAEEKPLAPVADPPKVEKPKTSTDSDRIQAIIRIASEAGVPFDRAAEAIANGMSVEEFIKLVADGLEILAPDVVPILGSPALIRLKGTPEEPHAKLWDRAPEYDDDVLLELFSENGEPVTIFWSFTPGIRIFRVVVAVNGEKVPIQEAAYHQMQYGGQNPDPGPDPKPNPDPEPDPLPVSKLTALYLYESEDIDDKYPWLANIIATQKIRKIQNEDFYVIFADVNEMDQDGSVHPSVKPWVDFARSENLKMPQVFLVNQKGDLVKNQVVPQEVDANVTLIKEYLP